MIKNKVVRRMTTIIVTMMIVEAESTNTVRRRDTRLEVRLFEFFTTRLYLHANLGKSCVEFQNYHFVIERSLLW